MASNKDAEILRFVAREEPLAATLEAFPQLTRDKLTKLLERAASSMEPGNIPDASSNDDPATHTLPRLRVYSDGAARGNPGPSGAGAVLVEPNGQVVDR